MRDEDQLSGVPIFRIVATVIAMAIGIMIVMGSWFTVDQGERVVVLTNGKISSVAEPGLNWKVPFFQSAVHVSVQEQAAVYDGVMAYSRDQQTGTMKVSVNYAVLPSEVANVYAEFGSTEGMVTRLLDRQVNKVTEEVFGQYNAITAVQDRTRLGVDIQKALTAAVVGPITIRSVQVENIDFSAVYEQSIEDRMQAEVAVKTAEQNALKAKVEAERDAAVKQIEAGANAAAAITAAKANAEAAITGAKANAEAIRLSGEAQAAAIKAKSEALASNPALIALTQAERWNGVLPSTMIPDGAVPFLSLPAATQ